jgi:competence protein ComGC
MNESLEVIIIIVVISVIAIVAVFSIQYSYKQYLKDSGCAGFDSIVECECNKDCINLGYNTSVYKQGNIFKYDQCWCRGVKGIIQIG